MDKEPSVSRNLPNTQERALSESSQRSRAVNYLRKELYVRRLNGFWIRLWPSHSCLWTETHWGNILMELSFLLETLYLILKTLPQKIWEIKEFPAKKAYKTWLLVLQPLPHLSSVSRHSLLIRQSVCMTLGMTLTGYNF